MNITIALITQKPEQAQPQGIDLSTGHLFHADLVPTKFPHVRICSLRLYVKSTVESWQNDNRGLRFWSANIGLVLCGRVDSLQASRVFLLFLPVGFIFGSREWSTTIAHRHSADERGC